MCFICVSEPHTEILKNRKKIQKNSKKNFLKKNQNYKIYTQYYAGLDCDHNGANPTKIGPIEREIIDKKERK